MEQYNQRNPAVKRLMREAQELHEATEDYHAQPLEDNLFEWHFTVRGPPDTDFEGGIYHGRFLLPSEYPMKPPNIIILTPNGRFETNKKICLSISGHHPESWQPSWSLRTALLALIGFMPSNAMGAIGSLECSPEERKKMARKSTTFKCPHCGLTKTLLKEPVQPGRSEATEEAKEFASQMSFTPESSASEPRAESDDGVKQDQNTATARLLESPQTGPSEPEAQPELRQRTVTEQPIQQQGTTNTRRSSDTNTIHLSSRYRSLINILMFLCVAGFISLCIRRVCFL